MKIIDEVSTKGNFYDREDAFAALRATLLALRDRLPVDEAAHVAAQLPILLTGFYYEGYKPSATPRKDRTRAEFLEHIDEFLADKSPNLIADHVAETVFAVLSDHISEGELRHVLDAMPEELMELWPEELVQEA